MNKAKFTIGQIVNHALFDYRGAITDVDPYYQGTEEWYKQVAKTHPPKDMPWYHVLVDHQDYETYVAERNLTPASSLEPVNHPMINIFFDGFSNGRYSHRYSIT